MEFLQLVRSTAFWILVSPFTLKADLSDLPLEELAQLETLVLLQREARAAVKAPDLIFNQNENREKFDSLLVKVGSSAVIMRSAQLLRKEEAQDMRAKLGMIALDYVSHPEMYNKVKVRYVVRPLGSEDLRVYLRELAPNSGEPNLALLPQNISALPIEDGHISETYRLAYEYFLLAPLNQSMFAGSWSNLASALTAIHNPSSILCLLELIKTTPYSVRMGNVTLLDSALVSLADFPSLQSFRAIAENLGSAAQDAEQLNSRRKVLEKIGGTWGTYSLPARVFEEDAKRYAAWQAVVGGIPKSSLDASQSSLLKEIASLPIPPKFGHSDPFAPRNTPPPSSSK